MLTVTVPAFANFGTDHIGQHPVDDYECRIFFIEFSQRMFAVLESESFKTMPLQIELKSVENGLVIINQHYFQGRFAHFALLASAAQAWTGELQGKCGALPLFRLNIYLSIVKINNMLNDRQA